MTKRIITENEMDKLLDQLTWKVELKYSERPGFKQVIDAIKKKRANCVYMVYVSTLSQNPADVREACKLLKDLGASINFIKDNVTSEDILKMDIFTLDNLTINTVKEDILMVVNSEETYNELTKC
ncbi:MAG: recombinase family protein [Clostridia bacterium]|nr:recombinase family protein [Clostridia bacterium]MBR6800080.1 recombinase family protein [Bacillota bacterium]